MRRLMRMTPAAKPRIRFRSDEFNKLVEPLGYRSDSAKARFVGVSQSTMSRILSGTHRPGAAFIAAVRTKLPQIPYEQLFEERS